MVIDTLNARNGTTDMPIDSYNNKMIDEIIVEGQSFHFAKQKDLTGTSEIVADNGVAEPIISLGVSGNTRQKSYGGYQQIQILDFDKSYTSADGNVMTWSCRDGVVTVNGKTDTIVPITITADNKTLGFRTLKAGTYTFTSNWYTPNAGSGCDCSYLDLETGKNKYIFINKRTVLTFEHDVRWGYFQLYMNTAKEYENFKFAIGVFKGDVATTDFPPYEPYVGGIPSPNPQYPQEIENANKEGMSVTLHGDNFREEIAIPTSVEVEGDTVDLNMASISIIHSNGKTYTATDYLTVDRLSNKVLYHQNVGKMTLTSTNVVWSYEPTYKYFIFSTNIGSKKIYNPIISNKYIGFAHIGLMASKDYGITTDAQWWGVNNRITIRDIRFDNIDDFKADLDQNPLVIEYGLAEEIPHDITNTDLGQSLLALATGKGTNYLEITGNLEPSQTDLSYWRQIIPNE